MIIKVKPESIFHTRYHGLVWGSWADEFTLPNWAITYRLENIPSGTKLTLSVKTGKKRKLVNGRLEIQREGCSCELCGGHITYTYRFVPNNPDKLIALLTPTPKVWNK